MSESDKYFHLHEAFRLVDAIKAINNCKSILALDALKKTIDKRVAELEQAGRLIEQKGEKTGRKPEKTGQKPQKIEQSKKIDSPLNPTNFLDIVLRGAKDPFTQKDVSDVLYDHYKKTLKHEISRKSADSYAYTCLRHMLSKDMIEEAGKKDRKGFGRCATLYKKKPKKIVPEGVKDGIYEAADDGKRRLKETLGLERELCDSGHFEETPEVTDGDGT